MDEELQHDPAFKTITPGRNWIGKFLNRHPELVSKFSAQFDKKRLKANDPTLIEDHFRKIQLIRKKFHITDARMYNMDEKGFRQGISDRAKVICRRRARGATGKVAQDGNKELSTVVEAIDGIGNVLPPLVIFKGKVFTAGWLQTIVHDLNRLDNYKDWKLTHSESGWTNSSLGLEWLYHFNKYTTPPDSSQYRLLILDGHGSHVSIEFIEYCLEHKIIAYCLPPHSTHILQPLDVGLFSPLQKAYGKRVDHAVRYGAVTINKSNFLPILRTARELTYTQENIMSAWRCTGFIPLNADVQRFVSLRINHLFFPYKMPVTARLVQQELMHQNA